MCWFEVCFDGDGKLVNATVVIIEDVICFDDLETKDVSYK